LGLVFSKRSISNDSIVFYSSSNGGISFDSHYNIASSQNYLYKVSLSYGRSPSENSGRYFAVWEEFANLNSKSGHIYTAHSEPDFNSPFTSPIVLDNLDPGSTNEASNPVIECQNNSDDNDSLNISEIILYEKYLPLSHKANIAGFYNKKAATSNNFQKFTINALSDNNLQPEICFNLFDSTFNITYFDSTTLNLPYYKHDFNMSDPDSWIELSAGYNDNNNLMAPYPKVVLDFETQLCANVWIGELGNGNGSALFDYPLGMPELIIHWNLKPIQIPPQTM